MTDRLNLTAGRWARWQERDGNAAASRAQAIAGFLLHELERQAARAGDRLPSVRELAAICGCSHDTVARALDDLVGNGRVESRRGSGFFVARRAASPAPDGDGAGGEADRPPIADGRWLLSTDLPVARRPGGGILHPDLAPAEEVARAARSALRIRADVFNDYNTPAGYRPLRAELLRMLDGEGIACSIDEIVTGAGATGVLSILIRAVVRPGDRVLIEDPCSFLHQHLLMSQGAQVERVARDAVGPDVA